MTDGLTNAEIGRRLVIAEATVKTHLPRLFAKLDVNDRTRAVVVAMEKGLLRRASLLSRALPGTRNPRRDLASDDR